MGRRSIGDGVFRRTLNDHEDRLVAVEQSSGGLLDSFHIPSAIVVTPEEESFLGELEFVQSGKDVLVHVCLAISSDTEEIKLGPSRLGIWTIIPPGEEEEGSIDRPLALARPLLPEGGEPIPVIMEALLPAGGFPGVLEPDGNGAIPWHIKPRLQNISESATLIAAADLLAGFGHGSADSGFGYAVELG